MVRAWAGHKSLPGPWPGETARRDSALWAEAVASLGRGGGLGLGLPLFSSQECKEPGAGQSLAFRSLHQSGLLRDTSAGCDLRASCGECGFMIMAAGGQGCLSGPTCPLQPGVSRTSWEGRADMKNWRTRTEDDFGPTRTHWDSSALTETWFVSPRPHLQPSHWPCE